MCERGGLKPRGAAIGPLSGFVFNPSPLRKVALASPRCPQRDPIRTNCGKKGHKAKDCDSKKKNDSSNKNPNNSNKKNPKNGEIQNDFARNSSIASSINSKRDQPLMKIKIRKDEN